MLATTDGQLKQPSTSHWSSVERVLRRAIDVGSAFDVPERDVVFVGIHDFDSAGQRQDVKQLLGGLAEFGYVLAEEQFARTSSVALAEKPEYSAIAVPVPLWPLSPHLRAKLLTKELTLIAAFPRAIWVNLFRDRGIGFVERDGEWQVSHGDRKIVLDRIEVARLYVGVAFGGLSPAAVVNEILGELSRPGMPVA